MEFKHEIIDTETTRKVIVTSATTVQPQELVYYALQHMPPYKIDEGKIEATGRQYADGDMSVEVTWHKKEGK